MSILGNLYFYDSQGNKRLVKENIAELDAGKAIKLHVKELNPDYVIYYVRSWMPAPGITTYDVGSHTEHYTWEAANGNT